MNRTLSSDFDRLAVALLIGFGSVSSTLVAIFAFSGVYSVYGAVLAGIVVPAVGALCAFGRYAESIETETTVSDASDDRTQPINDGGTELK